MTHTTMAETMTPEPLAPMAAIRATVATLPTLIVDTREQTPLAFRNLPSVAGSLQSGDYSVKGHEESFGIERKTVPDLCGSLTADRDRFLRECHRLRGFRFRRLVIVGSIEQIHELHAQGRCRNPKSVLAGLAIVESRYDIPVVWSATAEDAALQVERWAWWYWRESMKPLGVKVATPPWAIDWPSE